MARVGSIVSPLVSLTADLYHSVPLFIYGIVPVIASAATALLPETLGQPLPDTVQDLESRWAPAQRGAGASPRSCIQASGCWTSNQASSSRPGLFVCFPSGLSLLEPFLGLLAPGEWQMFAAGPW